MIHINFLFYSWHADNLCLSPWTKREWIMLDHLHIPAVHYSPQKHLCYRWKRPWKLFAKWFLARDTRLFAACCVLTITVMQHLGKIVYPSLLEDRMMISIIVLRVMHCKTVVSRSITKNVHVRIRSFEILKLWQTCFSIIWIKSSYLNSCHFYSIIILQLI